MFLVAVVWFAKARSFLHLAKAKWAVITEIEKNFEYAPFTVEWVKIKSTKKKIPRFGLVTLELIVPSIIAIVSIAYILGHFYCYLFER